MRQPGWTSEAGRPGRAAPEPWVAATTVAGLMFSGALLGSLNLVVDGVVHDGAARWIYAATMGGLLVVGIVLLARRRIGPTTILTLVALGDVVYLLISLTITDPMRYASPLMMLFPCFAAAWFLPGHYVGLQLMVTPAVVATALWGSYDGVGLVIQIVVDAGVLDLTTAGVYLLRRRNERLLADTRDLSRRDPLTGLGNRRQLAEQADRVWRQARREDARVTAMVLDLDHFKQLNDAHGHAAGDAVLQAVATALAGTVRPGDVLARLGGEELVVLGMVANAAEANRLAERLRSAVAEARTDDGHAVTASVGIALVRPVDGEDAVDSLWHLVAVADTAMYRAKQAGRDRVAAVLLPRTSPEVA